MGGDCLHLLLYFAFQYSLATVHHRSRLMLLHWRYCDEFPADLHTFVCPNNFEYVAVPVEPPKNFLSATCGRSRGYWGKMNLNYKATNPSRRNRPSNMQWLRKQNCWSCSEPTFAYKFNFSSFFSNSISLSIIRLLFLTLYNYHWAQSISDYLVMGATVQHSRLESATILCFRKM